MSNLEERIVRLEVKVDALIKMQTNHLSHHFKYNIMAWGVALAALLGLLMK